MTGKAPQRVRVTGPPSMTAAHRKVADDDMPTEADEANLKALMRAQLRVGLLVCGSVCGSLALLPLLFVLAPWFGRLRACGVPLPWLVLGLLVYPVLVFAGSRYVRSAERNERRYLRATGNPPDGPVRRP